MINLSSLPMVLLTEHQNQQSMDLVVLCKYRDHLTQFSKVQIRVIVSINQKPIIHHSHHNQLKYWDKRRKMFQEIHKNIIRT